MEYQKKRVKLITYIDHKSDLGGNAPPKNLAFLSVGGNFEFFGGNSPLFTPAKYPCVSSILRSLVVIRFDNGGGYGNNNKIWE